MKAEIFHHFPTLFSPVSYVFLAAIFAGGLSPALSAQENGEVDRAIMRARIQAGAAKQDKAPRSIPREGTTDIAYLTAAAEEGNPGAQAQLGDKLLRGIDLPKDGPRGLALLEQAARAGEAVAAFRIGLLLDEGENLALDRARALKYFRAAAVGGYAEAYYNVGAAYAGAHGVKRNYPEALAWFILAKQKGLMTNGEEAVSERVIKIGHPEYVTVGEARAPELARELAASTMVAELPPPAPLKYIATTTASDVTVTTDVVEMDAFHVGENDTSSGPVRKSAQPSKPPFVMISATGQRLTWPSLDALKNAAEANNAVAQSALAQLLIAGDKVPEDVDRALVLLDRSCAAGNIDAAHQLAELYGHGKKVPLDPSKAFSYGLLAARGGAVISMFNIGALYSSGNGTTKDSTEALAWFITAKHFGLDPGQEKRFREYLTKSKPDQVPVAEQKAVEFIKVIDVARQNQVPQ